MRIFSCAILSLTLAFVTGCQSISPSTLIPLKNSGFEGASVNKNIPSWENEEHGGKWQGGAYEMIIDSNAGPKGGPALRVIQLHKEVYGYVHQKVSIGPDAAGKSFNFSARLKSDNVGPQGWMLVVNLNSAGGILEQFRSPPTVGTTGWDTAKVIAAIPKGTAYIDVGFLLLDSGTGWATEPSLSIK